MSWAWKKFHILVALSGWKLWSTHNTFSFFYDNFLYFHIFILIIVINL